jgi:DNA modification methylase
MIEPEPFWRSKFGEAVVYCGDCRTFLPQIKAMGVKLVASDPPYSINVVGGGIHADRSGLANIGKMGIDSFLPQDFMPQIWDVCDHGHFFTSKNCLLDYLTWMKSAGIESWDLLTMAKRNTIPAKNNKYLPDTELILFMRGKDCYFNNFCPYDHYRKVKFVDVRPPQWGHPTEKQEHIMAQLIEMSSEPGDLIFDPFGGSFTTGAVAVRMGRRFVGCEISPEFCRIGADRIQAELDQPQLVAAPIMVKPSQSDLL